MVAREDVAEKGKTTWSQASGCAVEEEGRHYLYTARHVVFDKTDYDALPNKLYATTLNGESHPIDLSNLEVPEGNHDAVRIELKKPICHELHLAKQKPRYGETLFVFGDARGAGVMCADAGKVMAIGPLEFEHDVDTIKGMSGGLWWIATEILSAFAKKDGQQPHRKKASRSRAIPAIFDYATSLRPCIISIGENSHARPHLVNNRLSVRRARV